jgi:Zn-dependent peptidase ImmA (M78 family)
VRQPHAGATAAAKKLVEKLQIRSPSEIDVELIAAHMGVAVRRRPLSHEEGRLLRGTRGGVSMIVVSDAAFGSEKWRFVVAHELGHLVRHPDLDQFVLCTDADMGTWYRTGPEQEANDFAAELLMPESLFGARCDRNRPSMKDVRELASAFQTSLTATALRFVRFAPEPCAVVHSTEGVVDWWDWSKDFRLVVGKGRRLTTRTYAGDMHEGTAVADRQQQVDGDAWSDSNGASGYDLFEHSVRVSRRSVLTVLWHAYR